MTIIITRERSERTAMKLRKPTKDITGIHIYDNLEFPLMLYEKGDWDRAQLSYLNPSIHTTRSMIQWCRNHHIDFDILYPMKRSTPLRHPIKHLRYLKLIHCL